MKTLEHIISIGEKYFAASQIVYTLFHFLVLLPAKAVSPS